MKKATLMIIKSDLIYTNQTGESPIFTDTKVAEDYVLIEKLNASLREVQGQAAVVQQVKEYLFGIERRENKNCVGGLLTFIGPSGVGKTMTGQKIAEAFSRPVFQLNMSAFADKEVGGFYLFGMQKSYKEAKSGVLTSYVEEHPVCCVLLDEFEKAHSSIKQRFLQIFDSGQAQDLYTERNVSFRDVIIIVTMNAGKQLYNQTLATYNFSDIPQSTIVRALKSEIDPQTQVPCLSEALVSRLASGKIILFNRLRPEILHMLAVKEMHKREFFYQEEYGLRLMIEEESLADLLLYSLGESADARTVKKTVNEFFEKNFVRMVAINRIEKKAFTEFECKIDISDSTVEARSILQSSNKARVLVCCKHCQEKKFVKYASETTELIFAEDDLSLSALGEQDFSMAILDADAEEKRFSKKLFTALARCAEVPTYVYNLNANSPIQLLFYLDHGAVDVFHGKSGFDEWLKGVLRGVQLSATTQMLYRASKILTYETSYAFEGNKAVLEVGNLNIITVQDAEDAENFIAAREIPNVHFADIYGAEDAKTELRRVVTILKNFKKYRRLGRRIPRGILLEGDPGVGKTMLAKALAGESEMPIIQRNASEFAQKYVGEGTRIIREMFAVARKYAPSILFIDEIDTIAKAREESSSEWTVGVLNAFLSEMDGFSDHTATPVFVIAATNFSFKKGETLLDSAFLRRFDRKIHIELPNFVYRQQYLTDQMAKYPNEVSLRIIESIAKRSIGWSLGELDLVVQNALNDSDSEEGILTDKIMNEAFEKYANGESRPHSTEKAQQTAIHEAGHAVVASMLGMIPSFATISARRGYGGYVYYGNEDVTGLSRKDGLNRIAIMMAGREAECVFFGDKGITTGAGADLRAATEFATSMICDYGMDEEFLVYIDPSHRLNTPWVTEKVIKLIKQQSAIARSIVEGNKPKVEKVANALLEKISLDETDLKELMKE